MWISSNTLIVRYLPGDEVVFDSSSERQFSLVLLSCVLMEWFKEEWIDSDAKALGVYIALLYVRFVNLTKSTVKNYVKEEISRVVDKAKDRAEAWKSAQEFIESVYSHYPTEYELFKDKKDVNKDLELLERKYYEKFRKACYKYFKLSITKNYNKEIALILSKIKKDTYNRTLCGSLHRSLSIPSIYELLTCNSWYDLSEDKRKEEGKRLTPIIVALTNSGILWFNGIIPAPFLEEEFLEKLEKGEGVTVEEITEEVAKEEEKKVVTSIKIGEEVKIVELYKDKKPSREILESIVANVLERFGFKVETNKMAKTKEGREIEVDVWGIKTIGNTRFYVYASCKNWDKKVDRDVIFSEIGRISNLIQHPHLKIFVCKELTDPARETALTDGFTVIELKEKANSENADEIAKIIYNHLNELFTGIAPPELQRIAKEAKAISEKLKSLVDELDKLTKY